MSVSSTVSRVQFTFSSFNTTLSLSPMQFDQAADLIVSDGSVVLVLNGDYTVQGGGYSLSPTNNQLQSGSVTILNTGPNGSKLAAGDTITIARNISPVQETTFTSTGMQTPLMIEQDDDTLTTLVQQLLGQIYNPFPPSGGAPLELPLGWITAESGGLPGCIDALPVGSIPANQLPLFIGVSIGDVYFKWKLRPMQMGDPSVTTLPNYIVPITNPLSLIWVSQ